MNPQNIHYIKLYYYGSEFIQLHRCHHLSFDGRSPGDYGFVSCSSVFFLYCLGREPFGINGTSFYTQPTLQSTEGNSKN